LSIIASPARSQINDFACTRIAVLETARIVVDGTIVKVPLPRRIGFCCKVAANTEIHDSSRQITISRPRKLGFIYSGANNM
jgi:hypothetical protein